MNRFAMNELEIYLVSEVGEVFLTTVGGLLNPPDPYAEFLHFTNEIADIVNEIAFNESYLDNKMSISIQLREPKVKQDGI